MEWGCYGGATELDNIIIDFCDYVSSHLVLDEITFVLCTSPLIARQIIACAENIEWVRAFRKMNVKKLHVTLCLADQGNWVDDDNDDNDSDDDSEYEHGRHESLKNEMAPLVAEVLRPLVPRAVEMTDAEFYLETRDA